ncbi:MAG: PQQ-binding-like beta-propeller repeat protein [Planctomycetota bacterium]
MVILKIRLPLLACCLTLCIFSTVWSQNTEPFVEPQWKTELGGNAGALVVSGKKGVFGSHSLDLKLGQIQCVDLTDGHLVWTANFPRLKPIWQDNPSNPIRSITTAQNNKVVVYTNRGTIVCFDLNGTLDGTNDGIKTELERNNSDIIWHRDLVGEFKVFKRSSIGFGMPEPSPVVIGDRVVCATGNGSTLGIERFFDGNLVVPQPESPTVVCLNLADGKTVWTNNEFSKNVKHSAVASPIRIENKKSSALVFVPGDGRGYGLSESDGKVLWSTNKELFLWSWTSPYAVEDKVVICNSLPSELAWKGSPTGIVCYETETLLTAKDKKPLWVFQDDRYRGSLVPPVVKNGILFVLTDSAFLLAIDLVNSKLLWSEEIDYSVNDQSGLTAVGNRIIVPVAYGFECFTASRSKDKVGSVETNVLNQTKIGTFKDTIVVGSPKACHSFSLESLFPKLFKKSTF